MPETKQCVYVGFTFTAICVNSLKNPELGEPFFQLWPGVHKTHDPAKTQNINTV